MNCPQCGTQVEDGTSICPQCDHILDASFLEATSEPAPPPRRPRPSGKSPSVPGGAPRRPTGQRPPPKRPSTAGRPSARPGSGSSGAVRRPPPTAPPPSAASKYGVPDEDEATNSGVVPGPVFPSSPGMPRANSGISVVAPEEVFSDAKSFVRDLRTSDKLAFIGAGLVVLLCFLPWKETFSEGEVLGFVSLGFAAFLANVVTLGAIVVRVRNAMPKLHPVVPWLVQLGTICFGIVWCLIFIKVSTDNQMTAALVGNQMVPASSPSFGVYLALLMELVALAGTLMGLKEKPA